MVYLILFIKYLLNLIRYNNLTKFEKIIYKNFMVKLLCLTVENDNLDFC